MQEHFYPGSFGLSKQELVSLKSATHATPGVKLQMIRLFEGLRSTMDCLASMALAPTREEVCMRKGGHIVRVASRQSDKIRCCHDCGKEITATSDLRHDEEVQIQFHRNVRYWAGEDVNSHTYR